MQAEQDFHMNRLSWEHAFNSLARPLAKTRLALASSKNESCFAASNAKQIRASCHRLHLIHLPSFVLRRQLPFKTHIDGGKPQSKFYWLLNIVLSSITCDTKRGLL